MLVGSLPVPGRESGHFPSSPTLAGKVFEIRVVESHIVERPGWFF
jgi:hypothetical protein